MGRILIFTGKGGVGKTSMAATHARHAALSGKKTIIVSTDMAHNLSDIFEQPLGQVISQVAPDLDALEIDPNYMMENDFSHMKQAMIDMIMSSGMPLGEIEQLSLFPGMDELFSLLKIKELHESGIYDYIIVDCAPTGETLTLLKFPELMTWYIEKFLPVGKVAMRVLSPVSKALFKVQLPNKSAMSDIEKLIFELIQLQEILKDDEITSIRLVAMPEKMVVEETKRNYMYMNLYNFNVDGMYINRILPKDIDNPFFNEWLDIQNRYIEELEMVFGNVPIYKVPWFDCELSGLEGIDRIESVLKEWDVLKPIEIGESESYEKIDAGYLLKLFLPNVKKDSLDIHESNTDIIVKVGNFKRSLPKPNVLRNHSIDQAKIIDSTLKITLVAR